jgi:hypothetical protein
MLVRSLILVCITLVVVAAPVEAKPPPSSLPSSGVFRVGGTEVRSGGPLEIASETACPPMDGPNPHVHAVLTWFTSEPRENREGPTPTTMADPLTSLTHGPIGNRVDMPIDATGQWRGEVNSNGLPLGQALVEAWCITDDVTVHQVYEPIPVTIVAGPPSPLPAFSVSARPSMTG